MAKFDEEGRNRSDSPARLKYPLNNISIVLAYTITHLLNARDPEGVVARNEAITIQFAIIPLARPYRYLLLNSTISLSPSTSVRMP